MEKIEKLLPPGLEYLGMDVDQCDWAVFKYKDYHLTLHCTLWGGTRARLIRDRNDPVNYHVICDWCLADDQLCTGVFIILFLLFIMGRIDKNEIDNLPHSFQVQPIYNDPDFFQWWRDQNITYDIDAYKNLSLFFRANDKRKELMECFWNRK